MSYALALVLLAGCDPDFQKVPPPDGIGDEKPDTTGPDITMDPIDSSQPLGEAVTIVAEVVDEEGSVLLVEINFKAETDSAWLPGRPMARDGDSWVWTGAIPAEAIKGGGVDYYLLAVDDVGNESTWPEDGPNHPLHFRVDGG